METMKMLFLIAAFVAAVSAQVLPNGDRGPSAPITPLDCSDPLQFAADNKSLCWYYQCTPQGVKPRPCALGSHVHSKTRLTRFNPCTERFPIQGMFDCTRVLPDDPMCDLAQLKCQNGGTPRMEGSLCWCECPPVWQGSPDCSVRVNLTTGVYVNTTCPPVDWCTTALPNRANPCQNNGTCINQCVNFVCDCPRPFSKDRFCATFSCSANNTEGCPPGTRCNRGVNGRDEFYMCM